MWNEGAPSMVLTQLWYAAEVSSAARKACKRPLWVKLSPTVGFIGLMAKYRRNGRSRRCGDRKYVPGFVSRCPHSKSRLGSTTGGLSGAGIKPITVRLVYEAARVIKIPIIGLGGIESPCGRSGIYGCGCFGGGGWHSTLRGPEGIRKARGRPRRVVPGRKFA